ncbi:hypothetical protein ACNQKP_10585 [Bdellovibrio bacteriovorus]|uniref:hypothetical protein n=1 Tax=Bdellovibrio bacteriovorus TaxID=959 RepID=UPI003AA8C21F
MNQNHFAVLKVVALMLAEDDSIHRNERLWFSAIAGNYGATFRQRLILNKFLHGHSTDNLWEILADVEKEDHQRLLNFLRVAMRQDGLVKNRELSFYHRVQAGLISISSEHISLGRSLLQRENELGIWEELNSFGKFLSHKIPGAGIVGPLDIYPLAFAMDLYALPGSGRYILAAIMVIFILVAAFLSV